MELTKNLRTRMLTMHGFDLMWLLSQNYGTEIPKKETRSTSVEPGFNPPGYSDCIAVCV